MLRHGGEFNGQRILAHEVIGDTVRGGDREKFKASGMAFRPSDIDRNQWGCCKTRTALARPWPFTAR